MQHAFVVGVFLSVLASVFCSVGFLLQKLSHIRTGAASVTPRRRYCNRFWISGMLCLAVASMLDYVALAFVAQSIVAPLGAVTLVCNLFLGPMLLGEKLTAGSIQATAIIILGNLISITFFSSSNSHSVIPSSAIVSRLSELDMIAYLAAFTSLFLYLRWRQTRSSMTIAAGMISATSMMIARMLSLMTKESLLNGSVQDPLFVIFAIAVIAVSLFAQLRQMDRCLQRFEATYVVPIAQSSMCLCSIAHGMIFFREYRGLSPLQLALFSVGVAVTLHGQFILSRARSLESPKASSSDIELEPQRKLFPRSPQSKDTSSDAEEDSLLQEVNLDL